MTLTVIGTTKSRALRVLWLLEELGLPYEHVPAPARSPEARGPNPSGKIPSLVTADGPMTDSTAILHFLADREGRITHRAGTPGRARQDAVTFRVLDEVEGPLWLAARHGFVLPEERRVPTVKDTARREAAEALAALPAPEAFAAGDTFTVADIVLAHCIRWATNAKVDPIPEGLAAYAARMAERPAFGRAAALP